MAILTSRHHEPCGPAFELTHAAAMLQAMQVRYWLERGEGLGPLPPTTGERAEVTRPIRA